MEKNDAYSPQSDATKATNVAVFDNFYQNYPFVSPVPEDELLRIVYAPAPDGWLISDALATELRSCGFNTAIQKVALESFVTASEPVIGYQPFPVFPVLDNYVDTETASWLKQKVDLGETKKNLAGWLFYSVPTYRQICEENSGEIQLAPYFNTVVGDYVNKKTPPPCFMVTVPGKLDSNTLLGTDGNEVSFKTYLDRFNDVFHPSCWPVVYFPVQYVNGAPVVDHTVLYRTMEIFAMMARYTMRPMFGYVNCSGAATGNILKNYMRFEAFTALAYGAQGLIFWRYTPGDGATTTPVNASGTKDQVRWNSVQSVLGELKNLDYVFAGAQFVRARHTGANQYGYAPMLKKNEAFGPITSVLDADEGNGVLLSYLVNEGRNYLLIVNHSATETVTIHVNFSDYWTIKEVNGQTSTTSATETLVDLSSSTQKSILLRAGSHRLYTWE